MVERNFADHQIENIKYYSGIEGLQKVIVNRHQEEAVHQSHLVGEDHQRLHWLEKEDWWEVMHQKDHS